MPVTVGYTLSGEEHSPRALLDHAEAAERAGFEFLMVSDHYHPWIGKQGNSPFVWSVLGGLAERTERVEIGTGVTCPTTRIHPAIIAQAAATCAEMLDGRFRLGLGTGENLNEHILGDRWPPASVRREMLAEAVEVIRKLWTGEQVEHHGRHFTVENARIYTLPEELPPILIAASGPGAARLAGEIGDGLVALAPKSETTSTFDEAGGSGKPRYAQLHCCWAEDADVATQTAYEWWPNGGLGGELSQTLPTPEHFEQATATVRPEDVCDPVPCGPDVEKFRESIRAYLDAGFDHLYFHQIGPDQQGFIEFAERELLDLHELN